MIPPWLARAGWRPIAPAFLEQVTYSVRSQVAGVDSFTNYTLYRAVRAPLDRHELNSGGADLSENTIKWELWQSDLDNAGAPDPVFGFLVVDSDNNTWFIGSVNRDLSRGLWDCTCRKLLD